MSNISFCSYFSPCSSKHHAGKDFKSLSGGKKFTAVLAAVFAGLVSLPMAGLGGVAAFRKCVYLMSPSQKSASKTHQVSQRLSQSKTASADRPNSTHTKSSATFSKSEFIRKVDSEFSHQSGAQQRQKTTVLRGLVECLAQFGDDISGDDLTKAESEYLTKLNGYALNDATKQVPYVSGLTASQAFYSFQLICNHVFPNQFQFAPSALRFPLQMPPTSFVPPMQYVHQPMRVQQPQDVAGVAISKDDFRQRFEIHFAQYTAVTERQRKTVLKGLNEVLANYGSHIPQQDAQNIAEDFFDKLDGYVKNAPTKTGPYVIGKTAKEAMSAYFYAFGMQSTRMTGAPQPPVPTHQMQSTKNTHQPQAAAPTHQTQQVTAPAQRQAGSLNNLEALIPTLHDSKKAAIYSQAIALYKHAGCQNTVSTHRLRSIQEFVLSDQQEPAYFKHKFHFIPGKVRINSTPNFYDYAPTKDYEDVWVDFANANLGGGCFSDHGFVQEEIIMHEFPEGADIVAAHQNPNKPFWCTLYTRQGPVDDKRKHVYQGTPDPFLMKGLTRVQHIEGYRHVPDISSDPTKVKMIKPQKANIIAIASPKLYSKDKADQFNPKTVKDLFNSIVAGFSLVKQEVPKALVHSGKLGCGAFNNDTTLVFLLHCLAAHYTGTELDLHGFSDSESSHAQKLWDDLAPKMNGKTLNECLQMIAASASQ